ncbi:tRNA pseudouridine synthase B [Ligilactobacillus sp. WC1T17]|uniref:tRNA pseudouridine synthase B n=1 Tax=Ligilactobacillus ruminis TaxID=1623 RepID=A0ABY1AA38_9LACO|nr:tRNA pseudouridine synthase B [Ligilactobacillus ruminis]
MDGILPLNKDRGMTSNDAVFHCRRLFQTRKVGHSGTLDPNVDGVLPICIGHATKVVNYLMESGKIYRGEITLGFATETEDLDGAIVEQVKLKEAVPDDTITQQMALMCGDLIQIPPMYSAVKVNGRRLYDYARKGETVERPKRKIHVDYFKMTSSSSFDEAKGIQKFTFEVACGKGTYVRTLAYDLGRKLGLPAVMSDLTRLKSGGFNLDQTFTLAELADLKEAGKLEQALLPIEMALKQMPRIDLTGDQWKLVKNGGFLAPNKIAADHYAKVALFYDGKVRAVYRYNEEKHRFQAEQMIDLS